MLQTEVITRTLRPGRDPHLHSSLLPHLKTSDLGCRVLLSSSLQNSVVLNNKSDHGYPDSCVMPAGQARAVSVPS